MITVTFLNGCILATAEQSLWQYSYNQQLKIVGLELPEVFTVDFCNEGDTTTVAMIGSSGVVDIPNELLTSGRDIVAYVFQKSALTGGVTRCEIRIGVLTRPERDDETPTPEQEAVIDQYIAELNEGVEKANESAEDAEAWAVGERGGEPVSESDPTYENNAKYWAENISGQLEDYRTAADQDAIDSAQDGKINALTNLLNKKQSKITANGILKGDGNGGISAAVPGMDYLPTSALYAYRSAIKQDEIDNAQNANIAKNADDIADVKTTADTALQPAALAPYRTAADQDTIDNAQAADIAAINDKIPSTASKNNKLVAWSTFNGQLGTKQAKITANGILKGDGAGGVSAAVAGTDYLAPSALDAYRTAAAQDEIDAAQDADIDDLKSATSVLADIVIEHPTSNLLKADVRSGSLQANGTYSANSSAFGVGYKIPLSPNGKIKITPYGPEGFKYAIRFVAFAEGETSGTLTQTAVLTDESYTFTQSATKSYLMFCISYKHSDGTAYNDILDEFSDTDVLVKTEIITEIMPLAHMEDVANTQAQIDEQEETLKFDLFYLNIMKGASTFVDNKFINQYGTTVSNSNFCLIDGYYPVKPNTTYKLYRDEPALYSNSGHNWTWWDSNKSFISYALSGSAVTSPSNAAFLRFAVYISSTGSVTHADFDPSKVIITEDALPCFDDIFIKTPARPTFNGLKWIGVGDSITEANSRATYHYWDYIIAETGLNFVNMGVSGTGYKAEGSGDKAFYKRVPSMATDADVITIFGGVNDVVLSNADIGTETDTGTTTICGCVNTTLDAIETLYPAHMPIGIISPLPCACVDTTVNLHPLQNPNDDTCRMAQFVGQLALICKHRGIPFLDLFHQSNLRPWHQECNAKYFSCDSAKTGDGLHPNGHGHRLFYRQIMDFVQKIVMQ